MRLLQIILATMLMSWTQNVTMSAEQVLPYLKNQKADLIFSTILHLQPSYEKKPEIAREIADHIAQNLPKDVDWRIYLAILYQESSLRTDPQNCLKKPANCTGDYGIGQINFKVWGKKLNLDAKRLKTDRKYALDASISVLEVYKAKYAKKEINWFTRYHSSTPSFRKIYMERLNVGFSKINRHLDSLNP